MGSSGCKANVDFVLDKCGLRPWFGVKISGDMVAHCKPDPEIYLDGGRALGVSPADCVIFEDARAGFEAPGAQAQAGTIALTTTLPRKVLEGESLADIVVDTFADITDIDALLA